jgi:hypothetical protein
MNSPKKFKRKFPGAGIPHRTTLQNVVNKSIAACMSTDRAPKLQCPVLIRTEVVSYGSSA